ncbi:phage tail terminator family protein [Tissierella creatinophila]|uniref:Uncharacterized protein n=1 Tax=Tissierella creatinophila DSM 6911 TaxID=1123403 RepID=A0A1U7M525_TISCR|nr:hypothetical protein [Tissierella creatinophila]OLS02424.1 hypothetical protein TICRE_16130 [Tissierella creatinophila DSM 6911]
MIKIVKYIDIHKAIVKRIRSKFSKIVFSTDIEKAIQRPSFFIDFDNIKATDFMNEAQDRNLTVRIYYFSSTIDKNKSELLKMQDDLIELFLENNFLTVDKNINIEIDELDLSVVDKVLHCYFDIKISENYRRDKGSIDTGGNIVIDPITGEIIHPDSKDLMQELELKEKE